MKTRIITLIILMSALAGCSRPAPLFEVVGYYAWWMGDAWKEIDLTELDELLFFELEVGPDGHIANYNGWPYDWQELIEVAESVGTPVGITLTLINHDADIFTSVFESPAAQDTLLAQTLRAMHGSGGVNIDFELFAPISVEARNAYAPWIARLKEAVGPDRLVSVYTLAIDDHDYYDERALTRAADYLVVQGYDYHWMTGPTAGPTATLKGWGNMNWENVVARYENQRIPRSQLIMSVPYYGYEWPTSHGEIGAPTVDTGRIISYGPIADIAPEFGESALELYELHGLRRDPESGSTFYAFQNDSVWVQGWFDDRQSLQMKYDYVKKRRLGGVAIFPLAYDRGRFNGHLREAFPDSIRARAPVGVRVES